MGLRRKFDKKLKTVASCGLSKQRSAFVSFASSLGLCLLSTRAVMVEFTLYSVTANLYLFVTIAAEFSLSGKHYHLSLSYLRTLYSFLSKYHKT